MPSSLMARLKASQQHQGTNHPTPSADDGRRSNVVTPPPLATSSLVASSTSSSSLGSSSRRPITSSSSLAAAASSSLGRRGANEKNSNGHYVPQFKRNPLNATSTNTAHAVIESSNTTNTDEAISISNNTTATASAATTSPSNKTTAARFNNDNIDISIISRSIPPPPSTKAKVVNLNSPPLALTKTLIQQLLLQHPKYDESNKQVPLSSFAMCSKSEAIDRQQHLELSPFEYIPGYTTKAGAIISTVGDSKMDITNKNSGDVSRNNSAASQKASRRKNRPAYHPQYVIKKYRRSAAGGGALSEASDADPRTLDQLSTTVDYLLDCIFVDQMPPPFAPMPIAGGDDATAEDGCVWNDSFDVNNNTTDDPNEISIWEDDTTPDVKALRPNQQQEEQEQQHTPFSLSETVSFIDDRLRAVQKDLVTLLGNVEEERPTNSSATKRSNLKNPRVRQMQAKMVRYNIFASYLLSQVSNSKYEVQFGARALRTSLTCYLNLSSFIHDDYHYCIVNTSTINNNGKDSGVVNISGSISGQYQKEVRTQDEIMAYMALLHSSAVLRSEESSLPPPTSSEITSSLMEDCGSGWGAILGSYCKHVALNERLCEEKLDDKLDEKLDGGRGRYMVDKYPRWKWALELASMAQEGNYQRYFTLLENGPAIPSSLPCTSGTRNEESEADAAESNARFLTLARCCTSHSLNLIRMGQLRRYNHAFGKGEKVSAGDLARLLRFCNDDAVEGNERAIDFCRDAGLPIVEKVVNEKEEFFVVMKSAPIGVEGEEAIRNMCNPGRRNDEFVFGSKFEDIGSDINYGSGDDDGGVESLANRLVEQCDIREDVDDWEDRDGNDDDNDSDDSKKMKSPAERSSGLSRGGRGARNDEDGVLIPPSSVIRNLMG